MLPHDAHSLRVVIDRVQVALYLTDACGRVIFWNAAAERLFGWSAEQALGRAVHELLPGAQLHAAHAALLATSEGECEPLDMETDTVIREGRLLRGAWRLSRLPAREGAPGGLLAEVRDTTAEHAARAQTRDLEHQLQVLTDAATDYAFVLLDAAGRVRSFNAGAVRLKGYQAAQIVGQPYALFFTEEDRARGLPQALREQAEREGRAEFEGWRVRADGSRFWGNVLLYRLAEPGAATTGYVARDLSARRDAELELRENEAALAGLIHAASDAVISTDLQGRITLFNPAAERIFGRPAQALIGQPLELLLPASQRAHHGAYLQGFAASRVSRRSMGAGRVQGVRADGSLLELEASISQTTVNGRLMLTAILRDVSERVQAERALARYQEELAALTRQLMAQEKDTTQRLAQALHDQLGQTLAALRLGVDGLRADGTPQRERLERLADQAIRQVRRVLVDLRPPLLDEQGLAAALDNELSMHRPRPAGRELLLDVPTELIAQRWPAEVEYATFMIARESVGNALRHADAAEVRVCLRGDVTGLELEVADDGAGMAPESMAGRPGHLGMVGMRERALAIGADFALHSPRGEGTRVSLRWRRRQA